MKSSLGMPTPWTKKEIESQSCPYPHANFHKESKGDGKKGRRYKK
jgi:hypothetical protein